MLAQDRDAQRQTDEAMTVHMGLPVWQAWSCNTETASNFLQFRHRRIIDTEEDWLILYKAAGIKLQAELCRLQAERSARHRFIPKRPVITVQAAMRSWDKKFR